MRHAFDLVNLAPKKGVSVNVDGAHVLLIILSKGGHEAGSVFVLEGVDDCCMLAQNDHE